jgi:hypothetical protein
MPSLVYKYTKAWQPYISVEIAGVGSHLCAIVELVEEETT